MTKSKTRGDPTIFSEILNGKLPQSEKAPQRLIDESKIVIIAGGEAITQLLVVCSYFLLANPSMLQRLQAELATVMPAGEDGEAQKAIKVSDLEKLPYLTAIIQEGLRISAIVTVRLPRIATDEDLQYGEYSIPRGTPVSSTSHFIHLNPEYWPRPMEFEPERWTPAEVDEERRAAGHNVTDLPKGNKKLLVPFSKGSRMCIGVNLTNALSYLTLATVFRTFDFALFETTRKDVQIQRDCFNGQPWKGTKGVRATVEGVRA
jgi:cytochrome P450